MVLAQDGGGRARVAAGAVDEADGVVGQGADAACQDWGADEGDDYECERQGAHVACGEAEVRAEKVD